MALSSDDVVNSLVNNGFDDSSKTDALFAYLAKQGQLVSLDLQIEALGQARIDAQVPLSQKLAVLQAQRAAIVSAIGVPKS